jgi:hypothetical protein
MTIPKKFHFVWFGQRFPFLNALSIYSLHATTSSAEIHLHLSDDLFGEPHYDALISRVPSLVLHQRRPEDLAAELPASIRERLAPICRGLTERRAWGPLSDIARYAVLHAHGGVYLDLDTLTVRDLTALLDCGAFCGREVLVVDGATYRRGGVLRHFRTTPLDVMRAVCARAESGYRWFSRIEKLYPSAINGAVLGACPEHALLVDALREVPVRAAFLERRRSAIGPDLLQDLVRQGRYPDVTVHDPKRFYPLGPTMAVHLARLRANAAEAAAEIVTAQTYVVHWYNDAQGEDLLPRAAADTYALAPRQVFAHLAKRCLEHVEALK